MFFAQFRINATSIYPFLYRPSKFHNIHLNDSLRNVFNTLRTVLLKLPLF